MKLLWLKYLDRLTVRDLKELCSILRLFKVKWVKGGIKVPLSKEEMCKNIRRAIGRGTFRNVIERCDRFVGLWYPEIYDGYLENEAAAKPDSISQSEIGAATNRPINEAKAD